MPRDGASPDLPADQLGSELVLRKTEQQPSDFKIVRSQMCELLNGLPTADLDREMALPLSKNLADTAAQLVIDIAALPDDAFIGDKDLVVPDEASFIGDKDLVVETAQLAVDAIARLDLRNARRVVQALFKLSPGSELLN